VPNVFINLIPYPDYGDWLVIQPKWRIIARKRSITFHISFVLSSIGHVGRDVRQTSDG
jgi:hypothetical protein